jgi:signal transduction histidine kinase
MAMVEGNLQELVERYGVRELLTGGILLVDDDSPNLDVLAAILSPPFKVHTAESGMAALGIVAEQPLDVIITDQRMPEMTGVELLEKVRATRPDIAGLVLTAYSDHSAMVQAINRAQAFRFLGKPWDEGTILAAVDQARDHVFRHRAIVKLVDDLAIRNDELARAIDKIQTTQQQLLHMERLGTIGRLTAGVTHDLRNFLMGLTYLEQELVGGTVSGELQESFSIGLAGIRNLLNTLETMQHFARTGHLGVSMAEVQPYAVVHDAMSVLRMDMEARRRRLVESVSPDLPAMIGDRRKLTQVLVNLLRNAVQATTQGQMVCMNAEPGPSGGIILAVEDEGPGVSAEVRDRLFEAFSTTKGDGGMGMGLYMARMIVESHGGQLVCTDREGGGTRFEVRLVRQQVQQV